MRLKGFDISPKAKLKPRLYDYQSASWKSLRKEHLLIEPLCRICDENGINKIANTVDHIQQVRDGGSDNHNNLRSLCYECHQKVSAIQGQEAKYLNNPKWIK
jgi:5-methylcytosine-specific restriction endonuclease McrA